MSHATWYSTRRCWLKGLAATLGGLAWGARRPSIAEESATPGLAFRASEDGFSFDTGELSGTLRPGGRPIGLSPIRHRSSDRDLAQSYGLCSHYRLLDAGARYGVAAWDWPGSVATLEDGAVRARWSRDDAHPLDLQVLYRWSEPDALDIETTVTAARDLPKFESFLASYFQGFADPYVYTVGCAENNGREGFLLAEERYGVWLMFPRDDEAAAIIQDGRWLHEPHPVEWRIMPRYALPLAMRRDAESGLVGLLMAPPRDCFAVATPFRGEGHRSIYLSLFGNDLKAGQTVTARARLVIAPSLSDEQAVARYREYLARIGA